MFRPPYSLRRPLVPLPHAPTRGLLPRPHLRFAHAQSGRPAYKPLPTGPPKGFNQGRGKLVTIGVAFGTLGVLLTYFTFYPNPGGPDASTRTRTEVTLSPAHFIAASLTASEESLDPDTRLITLTLPPGAVPDREDPIFDPIWCVWIKDDDIQVERPYTPLEGIDARGRMKFWIKKYDKGEVGRWLHGKKVGNRIELRGPLSTWVWDDNKWDDVVLISGGTGITPFYQLLYSKLLKDPSSVRTKTRFTLLHSSRKPSELPPPAILDPLISESKAHPDRLSLSLFVDSAEGLAHPSVAANDLQVGRITESAIKRAVSSHSSRSWWGSLFGKADSQEERKVLFLVCGPEPMITAIAGSYGRNFGQGVVGGVLGNMGYKNHQVWKL